MAAVMMFARDGMLGEEWSRLHFGEDEDEDGSAKMHLNMKLSKIAKVQRQKQKQKQKQKQAQRDPLKDVQKSTMKQT
jgi:hypothetical protein